MNCCLVELFFCVTYGINITTGNCVFEHLKTRKTDVYGIILVVFRLLNLAGNSCNQLGVFFTSRSFALPMYISHFSRLLLK